MRFLVPAAAALLSAGAVTGATRPTTEGASGRSDAGAVRRAQAAASVSVSLAPGRLLVFFKRTVGDDPLASQLTVDRDGAASALVTNGGPGGEHRQDFRLAAAKLAELRTLTRTTQLRDTGCCDPNYYIYFVSIGGHSWRLAQHDLPQRARALIDDLNAITDAHTGYKGPSG